MVKKHKIKGRKIKNSKVLKTILVVAGLVGVMVGLGNIISPVEFNASSGIELGANINLINELKATGGGLFLSSIFILLGVFMERLTFSSTLLATMMYLGYGFSRIASIVIDGVPSDELVQVAVFEIVMGLIALFALVKYRKDVE